MQALATALAVLELTPSELNTLANLADGRPRNVRELSRDTGTRATTLTGVLDRLERRDYLMRELAAADRRSFLVTPTRILNAARLPNCPPGRWPDPTPSSLPCRRSPDDPSPPPRPLRPRARRHRSGTGCDP